MFGMPVAIFVLIVLVAVIMLLLLRGIFTAAPHHPYHPDPEEAYEDVYREVRPGKERAKEFAWSEQAK